MDIVQLTRQQGVDQDKLRRAALAVARHRRVDLAPVAPAVAGYGETGQARWTAWRRKERMEAVSEPSLDDQMAAVAAILDPVFANGSSPR